MNRKTMEIYINNQHRNIVPADWVKELWTMSSPLLKKYIPTTCLFICQHYYKKVFIYNDYSFWPYYDNLFFRLKKYNNNDFFSPLKFNEYSRI